MATVTEQKATWIRSDASVKVQPSKQQSEAWLSSELREQTDADDRETRRQRERIRNREMERSRQRDRQVES